MSQSFWEPRTRLAPVWRRGRCALRASSPWCNSRRHSTGDASPSQRCSSVEYCPIFSVVAPCEGGASPVSVLRRELHHGLLGRSNWLVILFGQWRLAEFRKELI